MTHDYHDGLPGYDPRQILKDGCGECEHRGRDVELAIQHMDSPTFARAWARAADFRHNSFGLGVSHAEAPLLRLLGDIRAQLDARGYLK